MIGHAMPGMAVDQAAGLRDLMARRSARMVAVVEARESGRAAVAAGLTQALARQARDVLLVDEAELVSARHFTAETWAPVGSSASGPCSSMGEALAAYGCKADFLMLDTLVQENGELSRLAASAHDVMIVLPGNDASGGALMAAYGLIKRLHAQHAIMQFRILLTECDTESRAYGMYCRLATVASRYLTVGLGFCGYLPSSEDVQRYRAASDNAYLNVSRQMLLWGR